MFMLFGDECCGLIVDCVKRVGSLDDLAGAVACLACDTGELLIQYLIRTTTV